MIPLGKVGNFKTFQRVCALRIIQSHTVPSYFPYYTAFFFARPVLVIIGMVGVPFNPSMAAEAALPGHPLIPFCPRCSFSKDHRP